MSYCWDEKKNKESIEARCLFESTCVFVTLTTAISPDQPLRGNRLALVSYLPLLYALMAFHRHPVGNAVGGSSRVCFFAASAGNIWCAQQGANFSNLYRASRTRLPPPPAGTHPHGPSIGPRAHQVQALLHVLSRGVLEGGGQRVDDEDADVLLEPGHLLYQGWHVPLLARLPCRVPRAVAPVDRDHHAMQQFKQFWGHANETHRSRRAREREYKIEPYSPFVAPSRGRFASRPKECMQQQQQQQRWQRQQQQQRQHPPAHIASAKVPR